MECKHGTGKELTLAISNSLTPGSGAKAIAWGDKKLIFSYCPNCLRQVVHCIDEGGTAYFAVLSWTGVDSSDLDHIKTVRSTD